MSESVPKSAHIVFPKIKAILDRGWIEIPPQFKGNGAPGNALEYLLKVEENNFDSPDLMDWEIKFHGGNALITLFHKTPLPRGIMNEVVNNFGWPNDRNQLSFRHTISGTSPRGFRIVDEDDRIKVKNNSIPEIEPYWEHNTILNALAAKLRRLILCEGTYDKNKRLVNYNKATAFWNVDIIKFCKSIEKGIVYIDFDARTKGGKGSTLRDHGTKFRIHLKDIENIYMQSEVISESGPLKLF